MPDNEQYAHVLLIARPQCERPLATVCASTTKNLEVAEAKWFTLRCYCGWSGEIAGVYTVVRAGEPGSCDEKSRR
jgi:hypothetical protein